MTEMLDRVAQAIDKRAKERGHAVHAAVVRHLAAAAIEAMLEPTTTMVRAGANKWCERAWEAMVEEALGLPRIP